MIDNRKATPVLTDEPFVESKEYLSGFWIIDAPDLDVALALAADGSRCCNRTVELRTPTGSELGERTSPPRQSASPNSSPPSPLTRRCRVIRVVPGEWGPGWSVFPLRGGGSAVLGVVR